MKIKEIEIDGQKFVIKQYDWDAHLEIQQNSLQIDLDAQGNAKPTMNMKKMKKLAIKYGVKEAPFSLTGVEIGKQPTYIMEQLFKEVDEFNKIDKKK